MCCTILELNWNQRFEHKKTKLKICHHMLTSSTQQQNRSFHVLERTRTSSKCQKMKNARAKRAKILFFIVKYANLWGFCCRRRGFLNSLMKQCGSRFRSPWCVLQLALRLVELRQQSSHRFTRLSWSLILVSHCNSEFCSSKIVSLSFMRFRLS